MAGGEWRVAGADRVGSQGVAPLEPLSARELDNAVGITTTVPMELLFAAGLRPVDLNNGFITSGEGPALVEEAEREDS